MSPWTLVVSYTTLSALPGEPGGLLSVALSRGLPRVGVTHHSPLWSPDVPRRDTEVQRRDRPPAHSECPVYAMRMSTIALGGSSRRLDEQLLGLSSHQNRTGARAIDDFLGVGRVDVAELCRRERHIARFGDVAPQSRSTDAGARAE